MSPRQVRSVLLVFVIATLLPTLASARNPFRRAFFDRYPGAENTALDNVPSNAGHCGVCHFGGKTAGYGWYVGQTPLAEVGAAAKSSGEWAKIFALEKRGGKLGKLDGLRAGRKIRPADKTLRCKRCHTSGGLLTSDPKLYDSFTRSRLARPPGLTIGARR